MIISDSIYENILEQLTEGIYYIDTERRITYWNKAAENITGFTREEVMGKSCSDNLLRHIDANGNEMCTSACPLFDAIDKGETKEKSIYLHHKDGHRVNVFTRVSPITDNKGKVIGAVELFNDLSKNTHGELIYELENLKKEVFLDPLTKTGNRRYAEINLERRFSDWLEQKIPFSVFFIDIDHFKNINDTYGHDIGDKVLKMVSNSLMSLMRSMDIVCRWGGEEFVILSPNLTTKTMSDIGERIRMFIEKSWLTIEDGHNVSVTISIGCSTIKDDDSIQSLMKRADAAMYQSKLKGRNRVTTS